MTPTPITTPEQALEAAARGLDFAAGIADKFAKVAKSETEELEGELAAHAKGMIDGGISIANLIRYAAKEMMKVTTPEGTPDA